MSKHDSSVSPLNQLGNDTNHATTSPEIASKMASLALHDPDTAQPFHRIGFGFCGSVWSIENPARKSSAIKREDMNPARSVYNDFLMHRITLSVTGAQTLTRNVLADLDRRRTSMSPIRPSRREHMVEHAT